MNAPATDIRGSNSLHAAIHRPLLDGAFQTLSQAMAAAAAQFGDREAYVDAQRRISFSQWLQASDSLAAGLADRGVRSGDVVAIQLESSTDYAVAYGAAVRLGAVATGLNTRLGASENQFILDQCKPRVLLCEDGATQAGSYGGSILQRSESRRLANRGNPFAAADGREDDPAIIAWTSGTTGFPKGAWFDHRQLRAVVGMAGPMAAAGDRRLVPTPFAHTGYMAKLWEQLAYAMTIVVPPTPWQADDMLRVLAEERITVAGAVPTQWSKLIELPQLPAMDLSALRLCVSAAAPAGPELIERARDALCVPFIVRYAMTEAPSITGTRPEDSPSDLVNTVGRPQVGVEVDIVDSDGRATEPGKVGQVRVRSACVMRGYWKDDVATGQAIGPDGWLTTGDLGKLDASGNLVLAGRVSDMYIRGGYNVYPIEVERVLAEHPDILQVSVVGVPAAVIGEIGVAYIVPRDPQQPASLDQIRAWCDNKLADYKRPDRLEVIGELPLTSMLKIDKASLRRRSQQPM